MSDKAIHLFLSNLTHESRLEKICRTTIKLKLVEHIEVLGIWENQLSKTEIFGNILFRRIKTLSKTYQVKRKYLKKYFAFFSFFQFQISIAFRIWKFKPTYIVIHNAILLPIGFLSASFKRSKVIYEPHELESEQPGMNRLVSGVIRNIEKLFIKGCHSVVSVSIPIAEFYGNTFGIPKERLFVVSNQPENPFYGEDYPRTDIFRKLFGIPEQAIVYLYQGVLEESRGIKDYLDIFSIIGSNHHIVFMGYGELELEIKRYAKIYNNIHFKSAVQIGEILKYTASADVGLFVITDPNISTSYRLSLPNKFFEYAICGLHICLSDNFELMRQIIIKEELGSIIGSKKQDLKEWILNQKKENFTIMSEKSRTFRRSIGWQGAEEKYYSIYRYKC